MTPQRLMAAEEFGAALNDLSNKVEMIATDRHRIVGAAFGISTDHHAAIVVLMRHTLYSSSFALLRVLFEAYLRGLWLKYCASDEHALRVFHGEEPPKTIVAEIEATETFSHGVLSNIKNKTWRAMCAYTQTGGLQLQRWQSDSAIEPTFDEGELEECLNAAELFGAMACLELVQMSKDGDNGSSVLALMKQRWNWPEQ
jgi:hypothetical protein